MRGVSVAPPETWSGGWKACPRLARSPNRSHSGSGLPTLFRVPAWPPERGPTRRSLVRRREEEYPHARPPPRYCSSFQEDSPWKTAQRREKRNSPELRTDGEEVVTDRSEALFGEQSETPYRWGPHSALLASHFALRATRDRSRGRGGGCDYPAIVSSETPVRNSVPMGTPLRPACAGLRGAGEEVVTVCDQQPRREPVRDSVQMGRRL